MQKFQHAHWLRARLLIPNSAESWIFLVQKVEIECRKLKWNWLLLLQVSWGSVVRIIDDYFMYLFSVRMNNEQAAR